MARTDTTGVTLLVRCPKSNCSKRHQLVALKIGRSVSSPVQGQVQVQKNHQNKAPKQWAGELDACASLAACECVPSASRFVIMPTDLVASASTTQACWPVPPAMLLRDHLQITGTREPRAWMGQNRASLSRNRDFCFILKLVSEWYVRLLMSVVQLASFPDCYAIHLSVCGRLASLPFGMTLWHECSFRPTRSTNISLDLQSQLVARTSEPVLARQEFA